MIRLNSFRDTRLVVFDLDGSLLNDRSEIPGDAVKFIRELEKMGVYFSFASGRLHSAMIDYAKELDILIPIISLDGSLIKNLKGQIIFQSFIPVKYVKKALVLADQLLLKIVLCHGDAIFYTDYNALIPQIVDKFGATFEEVDAYDHYLQETLEIFVMGDYRESVRRFTKEMNFPYTFGLDASYYRSSRGKDFYYFEARKQGCDKGRALKRLMKHLNVSKLQTVVMGDWHNDRQMFDNAGIKIAPANAVNEIKYAADYVSTKTNNEGAAVELLEKILIAKRKK